MLNGCRVLDCTGSLGWLAGRMLADLGAEVLKIEAPNSSHEGAAWRAFNIAKRVLVVDIGQDDGRLLLDRLIAGADILLETFEPGSAESAAFQSDRLRAMNPHLIHVSMTPFGRTGPRAEWRASDIELMAAGGAMSLAGEPEGAPMRVSEPQAHAWAGAHGAVGALVALVQRQSTGRGDHVDVSAQAAILPALAHAPTFVDMLGTVPTRSGAYITGRSNSGGRYRVFWPCVDGYVNFILYGGHAGRRTNERLVDWMREIGVDPGPMGEVDWTSFDPTQLNQEKIDLLEGPIGDFFSRLRKREFLEGANAREMLGYPVSSVADIADDPQLAARDFWHDVEDPDGIARRHCGSFAIIDGQRPSIGAAEKELPEILNGYGLSAEEAAALVKQEVTA